MGHTKDGEIIQPDQAPEPKTKIETQDARKLCICGICDKGFKDNYRLRRHESQVHTKDWNLIQPNHVFEPKTKIETLDAQDFKDEEQFDFEYTDVDLSEEFLSKILRLVDELCDVINKGDSNFERTVKVIQNLNDDVICYKNKLALIDSKIEAFTETKKQGHFLKDLLPLEEFENFDADTDYTPKVKKRKNTDADYDPKVKKKKKSSKKNTGSKVSTNSDGEIKPTEKRKPE